MKKRYIAGGVVLALVVGLGILIANRPTNESRMAACPEVTRNLIAERIGEPSDFSITERSGVSMEGSATVSGSTYWWGCGIGITRGGNVQVDVRRDGGSSSVILENVGT